MNEFALFLVKLFLSGLLGGFAIIGGDRGSDGIGDGWV